MTTRFTLRLLLCLVVAAPAALYPAPADHFRYVPVDELGSVKFYPDIRHELVPAIRAGFPRKALYLGNLWKD